ncbi:accessory gene regulator ArgB-like protein [Clostridium estertheticum]|uniref:accessory gene regulator ArgB-like protein n=1 Tax=Clostridium estertheticum TaxID=238834 RepID=UPI001C7E0378|nr:accessory gene regulator B family protein [Clostridium estertheticum]MBX4266140.1 accessory gene regulator B family protein [Clostridium estertheticum]WLC87946.1 accessory gene regulator B family protein [Clostridium estertheticum]
MINKLAYNLTCYIKSSSRFNTIEELEQIQYALATILNEVFKIIIILFSIIGNLNYLLFSIMILLSIRLFSGGLHAKTLLGCLIWSTLFFILTSIISPLLPKLNLSIYYILSLLNLAVVIVQAPYPNPKRPIKEKKRKMYLKILAIFFSIFWTYILLCRVMTSTYLNCGISTVLLQSSLLLYTNKEMLI